MDAGTGGTASTAVTAAAAAGLLRRESGNSSSCRQLVSSLSHHTMNNKPVATKKLIIANFSKPKLPDNYCDVTWDKLKAAVIAVQTSQPISTPLMELYQAVENLCSHRMAAKLYANLEQLCTSHVKSMIDQFCEEMDRIQFLRLINRCWLNHCNQMVSDLLF